jgi:hypothetical protein
MRDRKPTSYSIQSPCRKPRNNLLAASAFLHPIHVSGDEALTSATARIEVLAQTVVPPVHFRGRLEGDCPCIQTRMNPHQLKSALGEISCIPDVMGRMSARCAARWQRAFSHTAGCGSREQSNKKANACDPIATDWVLHSVSWPCRGDVQRWPGSTRGSPKAFSPAFTATGRTLPAGGRGQVA